MSEEAPLVAEYRRLLNWYPRHWRQANGEAVLGVLLDQADSENRDRPSSTERFAIIRAGLAQRAGLFGRSSSPITVLLGGVGVVLATVVPLTARAVFVFPVPYDLSWLNQSWQPSYADASAALFFVSMTILALGFRSETGIAGRSVVGRVALIAFGASIFAATALSSGPMPELGANPNIIELSNVALRGLGYLQLIGLALASVFVVRGGVVHGLARWGLVALGAVLAVVTVLGFIPDRLLGEIGFWGQPASSIIQLIVGVLFVLQGTGSAAAGRLRRDRITG